MTAYEVPIERGKIREFAKAAHSANPAYDRPDAVVPPTFLTTARLVWEPSEASHFVHLGFEIGRVLHAEEEYTFYGPPPRAGATLCACSSLGEQYEKKGRRGGTLRFAVIRTEFRDPVGELVAVQRTTLVETAKPPKED